jgi:serine/threonine-protein kinase
MKVPVALLILALVPPALAQSPQDKAASVALFNEGRKLMGEGKHAEACAKFQASLAIVPGNGTRLNLANCLEKQGRTASAWAVFRDAQLAAEKAGDDVKKKFAEDEMRKLEPRLARLTIQLADGADVGGLEVQRDGDKVGRPLFGNAIPLDPGEHVLSAAAPGRTPWSQRVTLEERGSVTVEVPRLGEMAPPPMPEPPKPEPPVARPDPAPAVAAAPAAPAPAPSADEPADPGKGRRILAYAVGGAGLVGIGVGTVFGLRAKSKYDEAQDGHCNSQSVCADPIGVDLTRDARSAGTISTIAFGVGLVAIATGVILYLTAPSERPAVSVAPTGTGFLVAGSF